MKASSSPELIDELMRVMVKEICSYDPEKVKADYERVMIEAGLLPAKQKVWVPQNESQ